MMNFFQKKKQDIVDEETEVIQTVVDKSDRYIILAVIVEVIFAGLLLLKSVEAAKNYLLLLVPIIIATVYIGTYIYNKDGDMKLFFACACLSSIGASLQTLIDQIYHPLTTFSPIKYIVSFCFSFIFIVFYNIFRKILNRKFTLYITIALAAFIYLLLYVKGVDPNGYGTKAWISLGPITLQLTDFTKITALLFYSALFSTREKYSDQYILIISTCFFLMNLVGSLLIHELGSFFILFFLHLSLLFIFLPHSNLKRMYLIVVFGLVFLAIVSALVLYHILAPMVEEGTMPTYAQYLWPIVKKVYLRISVTANIESDPYGSGYQLFQARKALWMSGWFGNTVNFNAIPIPESDMAFIALASAYGLPIALFVVYFFVRIFISGSELSLRLAKVNIQDAVVTYGITIMIFLQGMYVILGSCNIVPLTGLPIPFLSRGGTYLAIIFSFVGLLLYMSQSHIVEKDEDDAEGGENDVTEELPINIEETNQTL